MKRLMVLTIISVSIALFAFTGKAPRNNVTEQNTLRFVKDNAARFAEATSELEEKVRQLDSTDRESITALKTALQQARMQYKTIEFFLNHFLESATLIYNAPNKYEVEEPFLEAREPAGFQLMETILFSDEVYEKKAELAAQADLLNTSAADIPSLLYNLEIDDSQLLESVRLAIIRVITMGVTGFDAPELKTGIPESRQVLIAVQQVLQPLYTKHSKAVDSMQLFLQRSIEFLGRETDFNSFDRLAFLTDAALPLQKHLSRWIRELGLEIKHNNALINYHADQIFDRAALTGNNPGKVLTDLGKQLFFDKKLSQNLTRNCASCHQPEKYFSDGLPKSITLDGRSVVSRNSPSLYYSTFQYAQFWDGRSKTMEDQLRQVLENPLEMGSDHKIAVRQLQQTKTYPKIFAKAFARTKDTTISLTNISKAITAFLSTLSPMNSAFDHYMAGNKKMLTAGQIKGFNLFMGKAQCGTCHFAPLFNGLIPPLYKRTELEVLGLTKNTDFSAPVIDTDNGRFSSYEISYYYGAFKTPTLRNISKTAPYMHNGAFETLEKVMEFYNKGGAAGMQLDYPSQTLSSKPLNLTDQEIKEIISFLDSLTDTIPN